MFSKGHFFAGSLGDDRTKSSLRLGMRKMGAYVHNTAKFIALAVAIASIQTAATANVDNPVAVQPSFVGASGSLSVVSDDLLPQTNQLPSFETAVLTTSDQVQFTDSSAGLNFREDQVDLQMAPNVRSQLTGNRALDYSVSNGMPRLNLQANEPNLLSEPRVVVAQAGALPEVGIHYEKIEDSYSGLFHDDNHLFQGESLTFEIHSTNETSSEVILNFRFGDTKIILAENRNNRSSFEGSLQPRRLTRISSVDFGTVSNIISLTDPPATVTIELLPSSELRPGTGYTVDPANKRLEFTIDNRTKPQVAIQHLGATIDEGNTAEFAIGLSGSFTGDYPEARKPKSDLTINLKSSQTGMFANSSNLPTSITLRKDRDFSAFLSIPTIDDNQAEANGQIEVEIVKGDGYIFQRYSLFEPRQAALLINYKSTVRVLDNDQPRITVSPLDFPVHEGDPAVFIIKSETTAPTSDLTVNIATIQTGDFFSQTAPTTFVLGAGKLSDRLEIPTVEDTTPENDGSFRVEIKSGTGYVLSNHRYTTIEIWDDDSPRIWVDTDVTGITEGENAVFTIGTISAALNEDLSINVSIISTGGDFLAEDTPEQFTLASGKKSDTLTIATDDDELVEYDAELTVEIREGDGYSLAATTDIFATVSILDNDLPIWVKPVRPEIYEGETAEFIVGTDAAYKKSDKILDFTITDTGNFLSGATPTQFRLRSAQQTGKLELPTDYRNSADSDGSITLTITARSDYRILAGETATVTVKDQGSQPLPVVFISPIKPIVEEGQPAMFLIGTNVRSIRTKIDVNFTVAEQGNFIENDSSAPPRTAFEILPGRSPTVYASAIHGFNTVNDDQDESDGSITVTLQGGTDYTVNQDQSAATVNITDNDENNSSLPEISIAAVTTGVIAEGETARFKLYANSEPTSDLVVHLNFNSTSDFAPGVLDDEKTSTAGSNVFCESGPSAVCKKRITLEAGQTKLEFSVQTFDNEKVEDSGGSMTFTLVSGPGYDLGAQTSATVRVKDGRKVVKRPELNLSSIFNLDSNGRVMSVPDEVKLPIREDESLYKAFQITTDDEFDAPLDVAITVTSEDGLFESDFIRRIVRFEPFQPLDPNTLNAGYIRDYLLTHGVKRVNEQSRSVSFSLELATDDIHGPTREFTVELERRDGYTRGSDNSLTFEVLDDDRSPFITISRVGDREIEEGSPVVFKLSSPTAPYLDLAVNVTTSIQSATENIKVILPGGEKETVFELDTVADSTAGSDRSLAVSVTEGPGYDYNQLEDTVVFTIKDNDSASTPVISISAVTTSDLTEGSQAQFKLTSTATSNPAVSVAVAEIGDFLTETAGTKTWRIPSGQSEETFSLATEVDEVEEVDGLITVRIVNQSSYSVGEKFQAQVVVRDDDAPLAVSIEPVANSGITEGEIAWFRVSTSKPVALAGSSNKSLAITVETSTTENFKTRLSSSRTIRIPIGRSEKTFGVNIMDDSVDSSNGQLTVAVRNASGYALGDSPSATIEITDNDESPVFSVSVVRPGDIPRSEIISVDEGKDAEFEFTTTTIPSRPVTLKIDVSGTRSFIRQEDHYGMQTIDFPAGFKEVKFIIPTLDNRIYEYNGIVRVSLLEDEGYQLGPVRSDVIIVEDNDSADKANFVARDGTEQIYRFPKSLRPQIRATNGPIDEGGDARFTLEIDRQIQVDFPVIVNISETGNFVSGTLGNRTITIPANSYTKAFEVDTEDDSVDEPHGVITATIIESTAYQLPIDAPFSASVNVNDNDNTPSTPLISISPVSISGVYEGTAAVFRLSTPTAPTSALTVNYTLSAPSEFIANIASTGSRTVTFPSGRTTHQLSIDTDTDDSVEDADGEIEVTIVNGTGYMVGDAAKATVRVRDNDTPAGAPELRIIQLPGFVTEGEAAGFRVYVSSIPAADLDVKIHVNGTSGFIDGSTGIRDFKISRERIGIYEFQTFFVATKVNSKTGHGSITVSLRKGVGYTVGTDNQATVTVFDNADPSGSPTITIAPASTSSITEGNTAWFNVKSSIELQSDMVVNLFADAPANLVQRGLNINWGHEVQRHWSVVFPSGQNTMRFGFDTEDDLEHEPGGTVTITVQDKFGYAVGIPNSASVQVLDDDPEPVVSIWPLDYAIKEGETADFYFEAETDSYSHLNISIEVSQYGSFLSEPAGFQVITAASLGSPYFSFIDGFHYHQLDTTDDDEDEPDGYVTVTLIDKEGYSLGSRTSASILIFDDDGAPTVSLVRSISPPVIEGDPARFTLHSLPPQDRDINVNLAVSDDDGFLIDKSEKITVTIPAGTSEHLFSLLTEDDEKYEEHGVIEVTLLDGDYEIGRKNTAGLYVYDDEEAPLQFPEISVVARTHSIIEGESVEFLVTSNVAPSTDIDVTVSIEEAGNFVTGGPGNRTLKFLAGQSVNVLTVDTIQDFYDELDGTITAAIQSGSGYAVGEHNFDRVDVADDEDLEIGLVNTSLEIGKLENVLNLKLRASTADSVTVRYRPTNISGDFLGANHNKILSGSVEFTTRNNRISAEGVLEVALENGANKQDGSLQVELLSDDQNPITYVVSETASVANVSVLSALDNLPLLSIEDAPTLSEAVMANFTVKADMEVASNLTVKFNLRILSGKSADTSENSQSLSFAESGGEYVANLKIDLDDDEVGEEASKVVEIELLNDASARTYKVSQIQNSARVTVHDDDAPSISIAQPANLDEFPMVSFPLTALALPVSNPLQIRFTTDPSSSSATQTQSVRFTETSLGGVATGTLTADVRSAEFIELLADDMNPLTYRRSSSGHRVAVTAADQTPTISIYAKNNVKTINESQDAIFTLIAFPVPEQSIEVGIRVSMVGEFIDFRVPQYVTIERNARETEFTIDIADDVVNENHGSVTVVLLTDANGSSNASYDLGTSSRATINIEDNDATDLTKYSVAANVITSILLNIPATAPGQAHIAENLPSLSISAETSTIDEGSEARFRLTSSQVVEDDLTVSIEFIEVGDFIDGVTGTAAIIAANNNSKVIAVATIDDDAAEADGSITAKIANGKNYTIGVSRFATVKVSDAEDRLVRQKRLKGANQKVLSQLMGVIGAESLNTATNRVTQAFAGDGGSSFEFDGSSGLTEILKSGGEFINDDMETWQEALGDSSFEIGLFPEESAANPATVWGKGNHRHLNSSTAMDGEMFNGHLGIDTRLGDGLLAGLATSMSQTELDYRIGNEDLQYHVRTTSVNPYLGFELSKDMQVQITSGYGFGEIELNQEDYETELLDSRFFNLGIGGNLQLYANESRLEGSKSELSIDGESWMTRQFVSSRTDSLRDLQTLDRSLRVSLMGEHERKLQNGSTVHPSITVGIREHGMKQDALLGFEFGTGLGYSDPDGIKVSGKGDIFVADANKIQAWGLDGLVSFDSYNDQTGIYANISSGWGQNKLTVENTLWRNSILNDNLASKAYASGSRLEAEIGYGFSGLNGMDKLVPYGKYRLTESQSEEYQIGSKFAIGTDMNLEFMGIQKVDIDGVGENVYKFEGKFRW